MLVVWLSELINTKLFHFLVYVWGVWEVYFCPFTVFL